MSRLEPADQIEDIVGVPRSETLHIGRAVSSEQRVYILHSRMCFDDQSRDLRACPFSLALDRASDLDVWREDEPWVLGLEHGELIQLRPATEQPLHDGGRSTP